jgi:hypothetical protein
MRDLAFSLVKFPVEVSWVVTSFTVVVPTFRRTLLPPSLLHGVTTHNTSSRKFLTYVKLQARAIRYIMSEDTHLNLTLLLTLRLTSKIYESVSKSFRTESITIYTLTTINTRWEAIQRIMAAKLTILTHNIAIKLHLVAESLPFAVLATGGQSGNFWIYPHIVTCRTPGSTVKTVDTDSHVIRKTNWILHRWFSMCWVSDQNRTKN